MTSRQTKKPHGKRKLHGKSKRLAAKEKDSLHKRITSRQKK